ncbi:MAG: UDP-3-O-(3-hydroxymyristoyl)glucosamine N-acyltransferase, partial [Synechococcaceae bacterium WBB_3_034]|nr:UDP-3-O-(3-hydroxymyristoyl)glucosamine N-acyltransferase [Synechococcaceae bacterium WBB_3_034]
MRFSDLLNRLSEVQAGGGLGSAALAHHLGHDPELQSAAALDQAQAGQLSFLEPGNALAAALAASRATALLL